MSKLPDKPGPLLSQALQRAAAERAQRRGEPYEPPPAEPTLSAQSLPGEPSRPWFRAGFASALFVAAVVIALFAAWNFSVPKRPAGLKLDYGLDITRMDASRQPSPPGRAPSK